MILINNLSSRLKCYVDLYAKKEVKNELNESDYEYSKIKSFWAEITPKNGIQLNGQANTISMEISHKFVVRSNVLKELTNDMYFIFKNQRYDIKYFNPNYKFKNIIEIFCSLVVE